MGQEEVLTGLLVCGARAGEFAGVRGLADVVRGGAEQDGLAVELERGVLSCQPLRELVRHVVHQPQVGREAGRGGEDPEKAGRLVGQGAGAGVVEGAVEEVGGGHAVRVGVGRKLGAAQGGGGS